MPPVERVGLEAIFLTGEFQRGVRIYQTNINTVNNITQQAARQSEQTSKQMADAWEKGFKAIAMKAVAAIAAFKGVQKAAQFMKEATLLAARVETLGVALDTVGKNAGYSEEQIAAFEEAVKAQGITTQASRQALLMMGQAQIDFTHAADLARIAQDAAVIANVNSSEAFQRLTWVISTGSVRMARTLGLQVSFQRGYEETAAQIGKTVEELTEQERVQSRTNVVMQAGAQIAGTYEASMGTAGKQALSLARHIEEITRAVGRVGLGAFSEGILELTRLLKELRQWIEENEEELEALGESVTMLVKAMVDFADLELPLDDLTTLVENLTTMVSVLSVGIETVDGLTDSFKGLTVQAEILSKFTVWPWISELISMTTELRKENEALFLTEQQIAENISRLREPWVEIAEEEAAAREKQEAARAAEIAAMEEQMRKDAEMREKAAESLQKYFDRIADMQRSHDRKLADMAEDHRIKQERAWAKYEQSVVKEIAKGQARIAKLEARYQERREKAVADYTKRALEAEKELAANVAKAQADYALRQRQARERYELDRIQSERRYQWERARLVAEGDTLAIEQLDERYKMEQEEQRENEALRQRQAKETQDALVEAMRAAGREQAEALAEALAEQLDELREQARKEVEEQQQANRDRLDEMAAGYAEQQSLADEDYQRSLDKANLNYQRQQEDLGRSLAAQEELQEVGAERVEKVLDSYYGEGGVADVIMEGWHERENARILVTAGMLAAMASTEWAPLLPGGIGMPGQEVGMQMGGILQGPALAYVEPGVTEAFVPLTGPGAGGAFTHEFLNALNITGLEGAAPGDVSRIARELATSLTAKIRSKRRH